MTENEVSMFIITIFNCVILVALPICTIWHTARIRKFPHWSDDWWTQIIIVMSYIAAINCEIPALWSRVTAFYVYRLVIPQHILTLTTWDRWGRALFYIFYFLLTWIFTKKRIPEFVKETLS